MYQNIQEGARAMQGRKCLVQNIYVRQKGTVLSESSKNNNPKTCSLFLPIRVNYL